MNPFLRISCWLLALLLLAPGTTRAQNPDDVLQRTQAKYASIDALRARFVQKTRSDFSDRSTRATGTLYLQGNKFRIETLGQTLVTDGATTWIYTPSENQVVVNDFVNDEQTLTPDELFYDYPERFDVASMEAVERDGETYYVMDLTAKQDDAVYQEAQAHVRARDAMITQMELTDTNGTTITFDLTDIQLNPSLNANLFTFDAPDDAEIVDLRSS